MMLLFAMDQVVDNSIARLRTCRL